MRKMRIVIICILLIIISGSSVAAVTFVDVQDDAWYYDDVMDLTKWGVINGFGDETFRPDNTVSVDQFVKMIITSLGYRIDRGETYWAEPFINKAKELNIISEDEFDSYVRPITRGEMARLIVSSMNETYTNIMYDAALYMNDYFLHEDLDVLKAYYSGIITGYPDGNFYPDKNATRAEACAMLMRMLLEDKRIKTDYLKEKEKEIDELTTYYLELEDAFMNRYNKGFDYNPYVFDNGDMVYDLNEENFEVYIWNNGDIYIGEARDEEKSAFGIYIWAEGTKYVGKWDNYIKTEFGIISYVGGDIYAGEWIDNTRDGLGNYSWANGDRYIGEWINNVRTGLGKMYFSNGTSYTGQFELGIKTGKGILTYSDGLTYFGDFKENELVRKNFTMYYKDALTNEFSLKIDQIIDAVINNSMTTNEKIKAIHDYLVLNIKYDTENYNADTISDKSYSAYGALIDGVAVCSGYAGALNALLYELNIDSNITRGSANGGLHAWNYVQFSEGYYYVDVTWDDYDDGALRYNYYKLKEDKIDDDHIIEFILR